MYSFGINFFDSVLSYINLLWFDIDFKLEQTHLDLGLRVAYGTSYSSIKIIWLLQWHIKFGSLMCCISLAITTINKLCTLLICYISLAITINGYDLVF